MAVYTKPEGVKLEGQVPPNMKDRYALRIKEARVALAKSSGKPQIIWECEIVEPTERKVDGNIYALDSIPITYYLGLDGPRGKDTFDILSRFGLKTEIDSEDPTAVEDHKGVIFDAILSSMEDKPTKPDPDKPGQWIPILDSEGKPISNGFKIVANSRDILNLNTKVKAADSPY